MIEIILVALGAFLIVAMFVTVTKKMFKVAIFLVLFFAVFSFLGTKFVPGFDLVDRGNSYIVGKAGQVVDDAKEAVKEKVQEEIDDAKEAVKKEFNDTISDVKETFDIRMAFE